MASEKITKRTVDSCSVQGRDYFVWDDGLRGFGLKVTKAGAKVYVLQYRTGGRGAPTRRYTIGKHGSPWTPAAARDEALRLLTLVKAGHDPLAAKQESMRVKVELAFERYATRFLDDYGRRFWRPRTYASAESNLRRFVVPVLGKKPITSITRADIVSVFDALPHTSAALPRNIFALVRKLFSWALERGDVDRSPFEGLRSPPSVASRERILTDMELTLIARSAGQMGYPFGPMFMLLILTGQRRDEVAAMSWAELDHSTATWVIPGGRTKNGRTQTVPLNSMAVTELSSIAAGKWPLRGSVFTTNGTTPVSGFSRAKKRLDQLVQADGSEALTSPWRLHDLRRTFATGMQRLGVRFEVTEALLNHVSGSKSGVAGIYQRHDWANEKRAAVAAWSDAIAGLVNQP